MVTAALVALIAVVVTIVCGVVIFGWGALVEARRAGELGSFLAYCGGMLIVGILIVKLLLW